MFVSFVCFVVSSAWILAVAESQQCDDDAVVGAEVDQCSAFCFCARKTWSFRLLLVRGIWFVQL